MGPSRIVVSGGDELVLVGVGHRLGAVAGRRSWRKRFDVAALIGWAVLGAAGAAKRLVWLPPRWG